MNAGSNFKGLRRVGGGIFGGSAFVGKQDTD